MKSPVDCPDSAILKGLLENCLCEIDQAELMQHLDRCPLCQARLEELATQGSSLCRCLRELESQKPAPQSAYWPALRDLKQQAPTLEMVQAEIPTVSDIPLDFLSPPDDPQHLGKLSHFEIVRVVGRGGMGVVLHAFDTRLQRDVAIKVLDPRLLSDQAARKRFCREARAAASITHENVVAVHHVEREESSDIPFIVMQLIQGESLDERLIRTGRLELAAIIRIGMQTAAGLAAAHEKGLIHRDIKPGNILLEKGSDRVKLTDFGLARASEEMHLTRSGMVAGTPLYMSPEQARGDECDGRSDLFGLGIVLYEMCTGQVPFTGKTPLMVMKRLTEDRQRPVGDLNPDVPYWLSEAIDQLLEKEPSKRFQSARDVVELFEHRWAVLKSSTEVPEAPCPKKLLRLCAGWGMMLIGVGVLPILGLVIAASYWRGVTDGSNHRPPAPLVAATAEAAPEVKPLVELRGNSGAVWSTSFSPDGQTLAMAIEDGTVKLWDLAQKRIKATLPEHRGVVWVTLFAPDGKLLATASDDGLVRLWDLASMTAVQTFVHPNGVRGLAFSPTGERIASGDRVGNIRIWDVNSGNQLAETNQPGAVYSLAFANDGATIATAGSEGIVRLWDADTLQERLSSAKQEGPIYGVAFSPDSQQLATAGWNKSLRIWDVASGSATKSIDGHLQDVWSAAFAPSGNILATASQDGAVRLWNVDTGQLLSTFRGHTNTVHCVSFSRQGDRLASGGRDGMVLVWDTQGSVGAKRK